uniref:RRM domain-containing protein n=1 Tax=Rhizophora mucronata TaxID=61149 RepID=A0A2P2ISH2_RHIMU
MQYSKRSVSLHRTAAPSVRWLLNRQFSTRLFIAGLSSDTNETVLKDAFGQHGEIIEVKVICDRVSGKSKGYGFVRFVYENAATTALKEMDGQVRFPLLCLYVA